jgi:hypothetical protein
MARYRLCFIDETESITQLLEIEAANDVDATSLAWSHSMRTNLTVEIWEGKNMVTRATPMTARLLTSDGVSN